MSEGEVQEPDAAEELPAPPRRRKRWRVLAAFAVVLALVLSLAWCSREDIANKVIMGKLEDLGLPATYKLDSVGARRQVLSHIVIGDPAHPDLTIEQAVVEIEPTFGLPTVGKVTLTRPRLYGTLHQSKLSFGALDKVLFGSTQPVKGLPDLDLTLLDGRARIDSDYGAIGIKADGAGNLRGGFAGEIAAIGPKLTLPGCTLDRASVYGRLTVESAEPHFTGPLRLDRLACPGQGLTLGRSGVKLDARLASSLDAASGSYELAGGPIRWSGSAARALGGKGDFTLKAGDLTASYALAAVSADLGAVRAGRFGAEGTLRSRDHFATLESDGKLSGAELGTGPALDAQLGALVRSGQGTLLAPIAQQIRTALAREARGSNLGADFTLRRNGPNTSLVIPAALVRGGSGAHLLAVSRAALTVGGTSAPRFSGHFVTGGAGLPAIDGMIERSGSGGGDAVLIMREYQAGSSRLALQKLRVVQLPGGAVGFSGSGRVSGVLPGGRIDNLALPIEGNWSPRAGLAMWRRCTALSFDALKIANLSLDRRSLSLCPGSGGAILRSNGRGTSFAAGAGALNLSGMLGTTPIQLHSGAVGVAWPGTLAARAIDVALGPKGDPTTLRIDRLDAVLGKVMTGHFTGTALKLNAVPLDVLDASGNWRFAGGDLAIAGAQLTVKDREQQPRFEPLIARDATLQLHSILFTADAVLREPKSDRQIVEARIAHDLDTAAGHADLLVPGIRFDDGLQPTTLTYYAQGVIALAKGNASGQGRIDWDPKGVTSSGDFATDGLDFAAAFGPVEKMKGSVHFTDLLGLVTAPDQRMKLGSINPGIEVDDGEVSFQLEPGHILQVNGAHWPFIDGTLDLLPTRMALGVSEVRRYTLRVDGINAAKFVQHLDLSNLSASGTFDGTLPLIFDEEGGRIEGGMLISRPPGGNVSYIGELTYKDLSPMGNFAFQALRSLDFRRMEIGLDGHIDGQIVTAIRIDGVRQGAGAKRNFLTRRLAALPIRFNINVHAPFYQLMGSFRSLYDTSFLRDPRSLGLVGPDGKPVAPAPPAPSGPGPATAPPVPPAQKPDTIQHSDSRTGS